MQLLSIKQLKDELTSTELAKIKLLVITLMVGYLRVLYYVSLYIEHREIMHLTMAICGFLINTALITYILANPKKTAYAIHVCIISSYIGIIYRIFFLDIFLITQIQTIFIIILWSYFALNKSWGIFYSLLFTTVLPLQVLVNGYYFNLFPKTIDFNYFIVWFIFIINTIILILVPFIYQYTIKKELLNRAILNNKLKESIDSNKDLISTISHELRTPLNSVMGITNLLKEENFNHKGDLCAIHNNSINLLYLINKVLDLNKLDPNIIKVEYSPIDVLMVINNSLLSNSQTITSNSIQISKTIDILSSLNSIITDSTRATLIINNLIEFFIKNSPQSSQVLINCKFFDKDKNDRKTFIFMIENRSITIDPCQLNAMLDPFITDNSNTTDDLELAIVKKALENLNEEVKICNTKENGLNIQFRLPVTLTPKVSSTIDTNQYIDHDIDLSELKVLVVDDNKINIMMMNIVLKNWNIQFINANDGYEALDIINKHKIDIILMDLHMPGISGYETSNKIRNLEQAIQQPFIIAISASSKEDVEKHLPTYGINDFISKPVDNKELKNKLIKYYSFTIS